MNDISMQLTISSLKLVDVFILWYFMWIRTNLRQKNDKDDCDPKSFCLSLLSFLSRSADLLVMNYEAGRGRSIEMKIIIYPL
jgi:hypothetical protein